jgi:uncharacterized protein YecE (DUF72 family)
MDFGKLEDISNVDFTLPPDHPHTQRVLALPPATSPKVFVGPPIWANKDWLGKIYPSTAKDKDFLYHFARQFNTIELNVTHYQIPAESTVKRWVESVAGTEFLFCPKWPQEISHDRQLLSSEALTEAFVQASLGFGKHLGTTFLQLAPYFGPWKMDVLEEFLAQIPAGFPLAVEFRQPKWFEEPVWSEAMDLLSRYQVGTVISDVAGRRDVVHQSLSTPILTLRFVGNELHPTDYTRVDAWVARVRAWQGAGLQKAYIFVHCGENSRAFSK